MAAQKGEYEPHCEHLSLILMDFSIALKLFVNLFVIHVE